MKTQQEINELAYAYYDGMAEVMDRFDKINKVEETNKYIMARFGRLPEDDEGSELIVEYKTLNDCEGCKKSKPDYTIRMIYILVMLQVIGCMYATIQNSSKLTFVVFNIWLAVLYLMIFISKIIKHAKN